MCVCFTSQSVQLVHLDASDCFSCWAFMCWYLCLENGKVIILHFYHEKTYINLLLLSYLDGELKVVSMADKYNFILRVKQSRENLHF